MKIEYNKVKAPIVLANQTKVGEVMKIISTNFEKELETGYAGMLLLHTYSGFVSLNNPKLTWTNCCDFRVKVLPKQTIITLIVD